MSEASHHDGPFMNHVKHEDAQIGVDGCISQAARSSRSRVGSFLDLGVEVDALFGAGVYCVGDDDLRSRTKSSIIVFSGRP